MGTQDLFSIVSASIVSCVKAYSPVKCVSRSCNIAEWKERFSMSNPKLCSIKKRAEMLSQQKMKMLRRNKKNHSPSRTTSIFHRICSAKTYWCRHVKINPQIGIWPRENPSKGKLVSVETLKRERQPKRQLGRSVLHHIPEGILPWGNEKR